MERPTGKYGDLSRKTFWVSNILILAFLMILPFDKAIIAMLITESLTMGIRAFLSYKAQCRQYAIFYLCVAIACPIVLALYLFNKI